MSYIRRWLIVCTWAVVVGSANSPTQAEGPAVRPTPTASVASPKATAARDKQKLREGSRLDDVSGRFDFAGDRMAFYPTDEAESFRVLENLSLERIWQTAQDSNRRQEWVISGTITEFRGANYLLVTKAVIRLDDANSPLGKP